MPCYCHAVILRSSQPFTRKFCSPSQPPAAHYPMSSTSQQSSGRTSTAAHIAETADSTVLAAYAEQAAVLPTAISAGFRVRHQSRADCVMAAKECSRPCYPFSSSCGNSNRSDHFDSSTGAMRLRQLSEAQGRGRRRRAPRWWLWKRGMVSTVRRRIGGSRGPA